MTIQDHRIGPDCTEQYKQTISAKSSRQKQAPSA